MIIDTHSHVYLPDFADSDGAVRRALDVGVGHLVFPNVDLSTIEPMLALHDRFPEVTSVAMGLHPTEVGDDWDLQLNRIEAELDSGRRYVAVGEVGIDLYWDKTFRMEQQMALERQLVMASERRLPVILHCREGLDDMLEVMARVVSLPQCVFHSFGGTVADVERIDSLGGNHLFGVNGIVTFKNSGLREVLPAIGIERIMLETDAPYLAPVPHRGKRNESAYLVHTCACVAQTMGISVDAVATHTTANARRFFAI